MADIDKALPNVKEKVTVNPEEDLQIEVLNQQNQMDPGVEVQENEDGSVDIDFEEDHPTLGREDNPSLGREDNPQNMFLT